MNKPKQVGNVLYSSLPVEVEGFEPLADLALDLRWSWKHAADELWRQLDPAPRDLTQNPWVVLQTVSPSQLEKAVGQKTPSLCGRDVSFAIGGSKVSRRSDQDVATIVGAGMPVPVHLLAVRRKPKSGAGEGLRDYKGIPARAIANRVKAL